MFSIFSAAQSMRLLSSGMSDRPRYVRLYSTLGGTSAYTRLDTSPSASSTFNAVESIFFDMSGMYSFRLLKRIVPCLSSVKSTSMDHLSPIRDSTFLMGH